MALAAVKPPSYMELFERNLGVLTEKDQERVREARVMIIGVGGMGGALAILLARTGFTRFLIVDPEAYEASNMNRQICCFIDTLGKPKVEVLKQEILRINPEAEVSVLQKALSLEEVKQLIAEWKPDVVAAEADDVAYSAKVIRIATQMGIYAITGMPSGLMGYVMAFPPFTKHTPEGLFGLPENLSYKELHDTVETWENRCGRRWYIHKGKWRVPYWDEWRYGKRPVTQLAPMVWFTACVTAIEILKYIVGKWKLITAPHVWLLDPADGKIKVRKYAEGRLFNKYALKAFSIKPFDIGRRWRRAALKILSYQLKMWERKQLKEDAEAERRYQERLRAKEEGLKKSLHEISEK
ncbi:MAG: ThiF family adenylyltransferase [Thermofilum sp.]